ncbi:MAG: XTP/dITP diphosphohydrolase [Actinomycetota bacterium]|nr:XTP/dITP diphosphohydrolase [Actinomycetota bacterium]
MSKLVLATRNPHKVAELRRILAEADLADVEIVGVEVFPGLEDVPETGVTFEENATIKALAVARATGVPAVADDSGLCVDVLGGAPGVFSARWSGKHGDDLANLRLLLGQLSDLPPDHRTAHFACAAVLALPGGAVEVASGRLDGHLVGEPRGTNGFGYDPIFVPLGRTRTTAEMAPAEKDAISHRGRAFRAIVPAVRDLVSAS